MDANLSSHPEKNHRLFLFSGISAKLEKSLVQKIESLHGKAVYPVSDTFTQNCTHVIAQELSTTEKVLGALAGGKWLLGANYILDSYKQGHWLKEEEYELTDFNKVATYHRRKRMLKGYGLYEGWKILVLIGPSPFLRKFRRILAAGGADIALNADDSSIDFVVTKKEMLDHAKASVDSIIPLVDVSYIRNTLLFRHDPANLRKCDLRHPQEIKTSSTSADSSLLIASKKTCNSHIGKNSSERQADKSLPGKKRKTCSQLKQTPLTKFMKTYVKKPLSSDSICDRGPRTPEKKNIFINKYASESSHSNNTFSSLSVVYDVKDDNQNQDELQSNDANKIQQSEWKDSEDIKLVNTLENTPVVYNVDSNIQNQIGLNSNDNEIQQTEKNTFKNITSVNALPVLEEVDGNRQNPYGVKSNYISGVKQVKKNTSEDVTPVSTSSGITSVDVNTHNVELKEFRICLGKKITFAVDPKLNTRYYSPKCKIAHPRQLEKMTELLKRQSLKVTATPPEPTEKESVIPNPLRFIGKQSLEHASVSEHIQHQKGALPSKSPVYTVTKLHIWKAIVQFLRKRNHLNAICSSSTLSLPRGNENFPNVKSEPLDAEFDPQQVLDTPNYQHVAYEHRELTTRELHFYTCSTDDEDTVNEEELLVNGIDTLLLQLSSYLYPPPSILGSLLKNFVVETPFSMVHSRALRLAYMLLSLHSPVSAKMRDYYLNALQHAMKPDDFGSYIPWKFVRSVIQIASCTKSDEGSWSDQNAEEEEVVDKTTRALHLLEFIVLLLTEDVRYSTYGEAVQDLLTWQIFCGSSKNCSVLTSPVQQLLHLWMSQQTTTPALKWHLSQLVSVVLEVLWKFSGQPLLPVDILPASLAAVQKEIKISLKGLSSQEHLEVIRSLPTPWAQAVVTFIIVQEIAQCPKRISLSYIVHHFKCSSEQRSSNEVPAAEPEKKVFSSLSSVLKDHSPRLSRKKSIPNINKRNPKGSSCHVIDVQAMDNEEKRTPLHDAIIGNNYESVKLLLNYGGGKLLKDKTIDGKTVFDMTSNQEILSLLKQYQNKGVDVKNTNSDLKTKRDDHKELFITLANCYLEVSSNRYVALIIKKCIGEMLKNNIKVNKKETVGVFASNITENKCQKRNYQKNEATKRHMPQYLNLIEDDCLQDLSALEESAVAKMYSCIKQDKDVSRKWSQHNVPLVTRIDINNFFQTLCL